MFTGIVEELGTVRRVDPNATGARFEFAASVVLERDVTAPAHQERMQPAHLPVLKSVRQPFADVFC